MVRTGQLLADVEVGLGVLAGEVAGHGDRRHVVQCRVQSPGQLDHGAGSIDVGGPLLVLPGGDVIDRRAVHDMVDLPQFGADLLGHRQLR